jgi:hypothetical protein
MEYSALLVDASGTVLHGPWSEMPEEEDESVYASCFVLWAASIWYIISTSISVYHSCIP